MALQCAWHALQSPPTVSVEPLPPAPALSVLEVSSLGERQVLARLLMLWLQSFDYQPGISIPLRELDYARLADWLRVILTLDPSSHYPLLAASRFYAEVPDPARSRRMLSFVYESFLQAPNERWQWLAHAVFVARHRLHDLDLALDYARVLAERTDPARVPAWARQMRIFVLEDVGELEAAKVVLGGLIDSGEVKDPAELGFLRGRLEEMERRIGAR